MAGQDGITVFDFLGYTEDLLPVDYLKMMTNFEIEKSYLVFSNNKIDTLKNNFIAGYGEIFVIDSKILAICETLHRVCCLSAYVNSSPNNFIRRIENAKITNNNINWLKKL